MTLSKQFAETGQLPLFATAREIIEGTDLTDFRPGNVSKEGLMAKKLREASAPAGTRAPWFEGSEDWIGHRGGLTDAIKEHGYDWSKPVEIEPDMRDPENPRLALVEGHHRVAVMNHLSPDEAIPLSLYRGEHGVKKS
jgi:hypothetical protein